MSHGDSLRESIRARLASGTLPRLRGAAWSGQARGEHRCACCRQTIRDLELEYEPRDQIDLYAHIHCFMVWLAESRLADATSRRPPAEVPPDEPPAPLHQQIG
jgi:hypothetical protein